MQRELISDNGKGEDEGSTASVHPGTRGEFSSSLRKRLTISSPLATLVTIASAHMVHHICRDSIPILFPVLRSEFSLSYAQLGLLATGSMIALGLLQLPAALFVKWVTRKIILGSGFLLTSLTTFLTGTANSFQTLFLWQLMCGVSESTYHPMGASILGSRFSKKRIGGAMGIHSSGGSIGGILGPILMVYLVTLLDWRWGLYITAIPGIVMSVVLIFFLAEERNIEAPQSFRLTSEVLSVLRNRRFVTTLAASAAGSFAIGSIRSFTSTYLVSERGASLAQSGFLYTLMVAGGLVGSVVLGYLSDRLSRKIMLAVLFLLVSLSVFMLTLPVPTALLAVLLILTGLTLYGTVPILQAMIMNFVGPELRDAILGVYFTSDFVVLGLGPLISGLLVDMMGFNWMFYAISAFLLVASILSLSIHR